MLAHSAFICHQREEKYIKFVFKSQTASEVLLFYWNASENN